MNAEHSEDGGFQGSPLEAAVHQCHNLTQHFWGKDFA